MTAKTKTEAMFALVDQWRASEGTQKQFCSEHNLKRSTFAYWVTKHKRASLNSESVSGFVGVDVSRPRVFGRGMHHLFLWRGGQLPGPYR